MGSALVVIFLVATNIYVRRQTAFGFALRSPFPPFLWGHNLKFFSRGVEKLGDKNRPSRAWPNERKARYRERRDILVLVVPQVCTSAR